MLYPVILHRVNLCRAASCNFDHCVCCRLVLHRFFWHCVFGSIPSLQDWLLKMWILGCSALGRKDTRSSPVLRLNTSQTTVHTIRKTGEPIRTRNLSLGWLVTNKSSQIAETSDSKFTNNSTVHFLGLSSQQSSHCANDVQFLEKNWKKKEEFEILRRCCTTSPLRTVMPPNTQTITLFISVLNHDPEQHHAKKNPHADRSNAIATLCSDQALDIV